MKKITLASIAASVLLGVGLAAPALAAQSTEAGSVREGSASADLPQVRTIAYVGGGTWTYGVDKKEVYSIFVTDKSTHRASVKSSGVVKRSDWVPPTKIAYAHKAKAGSGNQAFWATRG
ncbi:lactococcin 972 family bacteriocin [Curtobacterium sp. A7_M15]|uniref:lactococcin 972 family bacteriocin n=1 Tax=Curtobacterium sp. A7_M15 TaxID=3065241 RepID=UPI002737BD34|nr:lactococcin 972 family bacteriocin [Curtobacterium sp. A7_M15]MDP4332147.1 lactococcin 972 family bacteriocin [Curtobacterium sp. A7_M15]